MAQSVSHVMLDHMSSTGVMRRDGRRRGEEMVKHDMKKKNIAAVHARYRNIPIFCGIYSKDNATYPPGLYLTRGQPATHTLTRLGDVPQALPIYVPPVDPPRPVCPHHAAPPSPSAVDDRSTLFEDNVNGEA